MDGATILHADLDAFYASVEQLLDPSLRGKAIAVGGGVVLAASYEAKAFGVRTAMGGAQAARLCPNAAVVSPRFSAYVEASRAVFEVFDDTTPIVEGLSIDEAFLDVGGLRRVSGSPVEIAQRLRKDVRERVGLPIMVEGDRPLLNIYAVMQVNPANGPKVNAAGGKAFADFMLTPETQAIIKTFGVDKYGQALFVPIAGKKDEDL